MATKTLTAEMLQRIDAYWRAANYLSVGQIYLCDNPLLRRPLSLSDVKHMLLGHWGTTPGQNFIYAHLNRIIKQYDLNMIYVSGPGHGGPAVVANTYLEGTYSEVYPDISQDEVDLMKLQPQREHPHGLSEQDFDALFTKDKPVIFAFHAYPWLIHRLTYRRTNHDNIHVRGYKEEGTITTPFDMTVLNELDRFHLVLDTLERLPHIGDKSSHLKQKLQDKLLEHKQYIVKHGQDLPEIREWRWSAPQA